MATKEEILNKYADGYLSVAGGGIFYPETNVLAAMEEYASQFKREWISVEDELPPIDETDDWNRKTQISKDVFTHSKFGMIRGRYIHTAKFWTVDGVTSSDGIAVTHWQPLPNPPGK